MNFKISVVSEGERLRVSEGAFGSKGEVGLLHPIDIDQVPRYLSDILTVADSTSSLSLLYRTSLW